MTWSFVGFTLYMPTLRFECGAEVNGAVLGVKRGAKKTVKTRREVRTPAGYAGGYWLGTAENDATNWEKKRIRAGGNCMLPCASRKENERLSRE